MKIDLQSIIDKKYNMLTILDAYREKDNSGKNRIYCNCICDCGNYKEHIPFKHIKANRTMSCGCLQKKSVAERNKKMSKKYNRYQINNEYVVGIASNCDKSFLIDIDDYDLVKDYCWSYDNGYMRAFDTKTKKVLKLHRLIVGSNEKIDGYYIDHINHITTDNRKCNLRACSHIENSANKKDKHTSSSGFMNVYDCGCYHNGDRKWCVSIRTNGVSKHIGYYRNFSEACKNAIMSSLKYHGTFSPYYYLTKDEIENIIIDATNNHYDM